MGYLVWCLILCLAVSGLGHPLFPYDIVDLSRDLDEKSIYYPTLSGYKRTVDLRGKVINGVWVFSNTIEMTEHMGSHVDAPVHFNEFSWNLHQIPIDRMIGPGVIVNVKEKVKTNPNYRVSQSDLDDWEAKYGKIPPGAVVIMNSGWHERYPDRKRVFNTDNPNDTATYHHPGWHEDAAYWLINTRKIHVIGVDVPSIDYGQSTTYPVHVLFSKENIVGLENVAYLDKIPPSGTIISAAAMKTKNGSGSPTRIYAMVPTDSTNDCSNSQFSLTVLSFSFVLTFLYHT